MALPEIRVHFLISWIGLLLMKGVFLEDCVARLEVLWLVPGPAQVA